MEKTIEIAGIPIDNVTYNDALELIDRLVHFGQQAQFITVNPEMLLRASCDPAFATILRHATLRTPDGVGVLWAAHYLQKPERLSFFSSRLRWLSSLFSIFLNPNRIQEPLRERVTGTDLMKRIVEGSQTHPWTLFLLGAADGVGEQAIRNLSLIYPKAKFVGFFSGSPKAEDDEEIIRRIHLAQPNIIFVAYGSPAQEYWIQRNLTRLPSVRVAIGVGGAFDFHAGHVLRAPRWMQKIGLEWFWRLCREPRRIGRIWNAAIVFPQLIYRQKYLNRR
jgi:N-acetylglucosaminyldiphosphoundecaprenol N-acetyl-beta-D-mannosaminyltransferase